MVADKHTPWILWPVAALWRLIAGIIGMTGRLVTIILGAALVLVGVISLTLVGAAIGIPLAIFGLLLVVRGLF